MTKEQLNKGVEVDSNLKDVDSKLNLTSNNCKVDITLTSGSRNESFNDPFYEDLRTQVRTMLQEALEKRKAELQAEFDEL